MATFTQVSGSDFTKKLVEGVNPSYDQPRAPSAIRLSFETDETTFISRQREANDKAAVSIGAHITGEAVDLGVSASKTTPIERPELGGWLTRPDDFDVILFWCLDRVVRSVATCPRSWGGRASTASG
ncbi:recombinase family protein [Streptomyces sp. NPDC004838]